MTDNKQTVLTDAEIDAAIGISEHTSNATKAMLRAVASSIQSAVLAKLRAAGEPVAWRDPDNLDPGQSVTFDPETAAKWPHIYRQPLYAASQDIAGYDPLEGTGDGGPHEARLLKQRQEG